MYGLRNRRRRVLGLAAAAIAIGLVPAPQAHGAPAISCSYVEVGPPGPAGNEVRVRIRSQIWGAAIARQGDRVTVSSLRLDGGEMASSAGQPRSVARVATALSAADARASRALSCAGGALSVTEVDLISVLPARRVLAPLLLIDLRGGRLAPGASDEGDGSSEIEVNVRSNDLAAFPVVDIRSGASDDRFELGRTQGRPGINLNPDELQPDVDVQVSSIFMFVGFLSGAGDDEVRATGGPGFDGPLAAFLFALLGKGDDLLRSGPGLSIARGGEGDDLLRSGPSLSIALGGRGDDVLLGGASINALRGGPGRDTMRGRRNRDQLVGGPQRDDLLAGPGRDKIHSADGRHDRVRCGRGRDSLVADRRDGRRGCELVKRRGGHR